MIKKNIIAILIFLTVSGLLFSRSIYFDNSLSSDQTFFQLVYLGKTNPNFYDYRVPALDSYIPFKITNYLRLFFVDPVWVYRILLPILIFSFLVAFYYILQKLIGNYVLSIIVPIISLLPRMALGSQGWGIFSLGNAAHRAFIQPFILLVFLFFYKYRDNARALTLIFFLHGVISALYPTQGFYFAAILLLVYLFFNGLNKKTLGLSFIYGLAFLIGAIWYIIPNLSIGFNTTRLSPELAVKFNEALRYRFSYTFYPAALYTYIRSNLIDVAMLIAAYLYVNHKKNLISPERKKLLHFLNVFIIAIAMVTFILPLLQDFYVKLFHARLVVFDQFGESKFFYLALYVGLAITLEYWNKKLPYSKIKKGCLLALFSIIFLLANSGLIKTFAGNSEFFLNLIRKGYDLNVYSSLTDDNFSKTCQWLKEASAKDRVIMAEDFAIRSCAERRTWVNFKEGMVYLYSKTPAEFVAWYERIKEQSAAYLSNNFGQLETIAQKNNLTYIVIEKNKWQGDLPADKIKFKNTNYIVIQTK